MEKFPLYNTDDTPEGYKVKKELKQHFFTYVLAFWVLELTPDKKNRRQGATTNLESKHLSCININTLHFVNLGGLSQISKQVQLR
jgi:hypothetical protein